VHARVPQAQLLGCALLAPLGEAPDGARTAEIAAFCVAPEYRGSGRGDTLLDYLGATWRTVLHMGLPAAGYQVCGCWPCL